MKPKKESPWLTRSGFTGSWLRDERGRGSGTWACWSWMRDHVSGLRKSRRMRFVARRTPLPLSSFRVTIGLAGAGWYMVDGILTYTIGGLDGFLKRNIRAGRSFFYVEVE